MPLQIFACGPAVADAPVVGDDDLPAPERRVGLHLDRVPVGRQQTLELQRLRRVAVSSEAPVSEASVPHLVRPLYL